MAVRAGAKRAVSRLFAGKKPRSLWGGATPKEQRLYKQTVGEKTKRKQPKRIGDFKAGRKKSPLEVYRELNKIALTSSRDAQSVLIRDYALKLFCNERTKTFFNTFFAGQVGLPYEERKNQLMERINMFLDATPEERKKRISALLEEIAEAKKDIEGSAALAVNAFNYLPVKLNSKTRKALQGEKRYLQTNPEVYTEEVLRQEIQDTKERWEAEAERYRGYKPSFYNPSLSTYNEKLYGIQQSRRMELFRKSYERLVGLYNSRSWESSVRPAQRPAEEQIQISNAHFLGNGLAIAAANLKILRAELKQLGGLK
ncbi:MAG: hypothetical protein NUV67_02680 [archaeon]|nr:hypothetical protein [archaeon]